MKKNYVDKDLIEKSVSNASASMKIEGFKVSNDEEKKLIKELKRKNDK